MQILDLNHNLLDDVAMVFLAKGNWSCLTSLALHGNLITSTGLIRLTNGDWPRLSSLTIDEDVVSDAAWATLSADRYQPKWRLGQERIDLPRSCARGADWLPWPRLFRVCVHLSGCVSSPCLAGNAGFTVLHMQVLDLNTNRLSVDAAASLVAAQTPQLTGLDLGGNQLSSAAVVHLVKGVWPCLWELRLCNNLLDNASMLYLATGNWPCFYP